MPVLVTIAAVSALFGGSKDKASFHNPAGLRAKLEGLPEGSTRSRSLALVDKLDRLVEEYDDARIAVIEVYTKDVEQQKTTPDRLTDDFEPLDRARDKVYQELIEMRQSLIDTLSPEEWDKVFG